MWNLTLVQTEIVKEVFTVSWQIPDLNKWTWIILGFVDLFHHMFPIILSQVTNLFPTLFSICCVKGSLWCCSPQFPCVLQMWSLILSQWYTLAKCSLCCSHGSHVSMNFIPFAFLPNVFSCSTSAHVSSKHVPSLIQMFCQMFPMFLLCPPCCSHKVSWLNIELERNKEGANLQGASPNPNMCKIRIII
jgi:hypothetical protein